MPPERFDVTFIRGPRDLSPWKRAARQIELQTNSPQIGADALHAQTAHEKQRHPGKQELFPNVVYQERGRDR